MIEIKAQQIETIEKIDEERVKEIKKRKKRGKTRRWDINYDYINKKRKKCQSKQPQS